MLEKGAEIKGYRIEGLLGRGGMGEVYEAVQIELGRRVAFKVLHTALGGDEDFRKRFRREGRLQATLDHPNVVTVYEAGEIDEGLFLTMRLIDGVTLKQLIGGGMDPERALRILAPVADALDAAHARGLVHRDVKPQNILVGQSDHPFLADFGLTRGKDQTAFTRSGQIVGTIDYIAPEQLRGETGDGACDIYALSGVLYECLTGSVPYPRPSDAAVMYSHLNDAPPSVAAVRQDLPAGLDAVIARGMAKDPGERPTSAGALVASAAAELGSRPAAALAGTTKKADRDATRRYTSPGATRSADEEPTARTAALGSRRRGAGALLGVAGLAALGVLAFVGGRALGGSDTPKLTTEVSSSAVALRAPGDWSATSSGEEPAIPGLGLQNVAGTAPVQRDASGAMAGMTDAQGPTLIPATFARRAVGGLPSPDAVSLGKLEALRYRGVEVRGFDRDVTLYASPSSAGVATVACYTPSGGDSGFAGTCETIAQTLELNRGTPYPLATPAEMERALTRAIGTLSAKRRNGRRALARAGTDDAQAGAAKSLAASYAEAAASLRGLRVSPAIAGEVSAAASACADAAAAYRQMSAAAEAGDSGAFAAAGRRAAAAEARLNRALAALHRPLTET